MFKTPLFFALLSFAALQAKSDNHHKDGYVSVTISNPGQQALVAGLSAPIYFDVNLVKPFNIVQPYQSDNSQFCVKREGAYLIGWKMNLSNSAEDVVTFTIWDMKGETPIAATALTVPVKGTVPAAAQFIIDLEKNGVIKLVAESQNGNTEMIQPTFFMTRIGH